MNTIKTSVDDELRLSRIQLRRAMRAADELPGFDGDIEEIILDLVGKIERLVLERLVPLRMRDLH